MYKRADKSSTWLLYTFAATFFAGISNYLIGDLVTKYGMKGLYPASLGNILLYSIYHCTASNKIKYTCSAWKATSLRGASHLLMMVAAALAFLNSDGSSINHGIITSLFMSSVLFTTGLFWLFYNEKVSYQIGFGMFILIAGVICIGYKEQATENIPNE